MPTSEQKSVSEVLEKTRYQEVNLSKGPFDIADRVSKDGPRDIYEEIRKMLKDGQPYDLSRPPSGAAPDATPTEAEARIMQKLDPSGNPVEAYLQNIAGLRRHLEENYDYAKRVESHIDKQRQKVAHDVLSLQERLASIQTSKVRL